ncbi:D-alanyl-lipoteichoic acid biosynthesis protein DltB, partial [Lactobacillus acidophilus]
FFPTISSVHIDRYRRFKKVYYKFPTRDAYIKYLQYAVRYLFKGFLYKFIIVWFFVTYLIPKISDAALSLGNANGGLKLSWL